VTAGTGAGAAGVGAGAADREGAARRGAGSARRGGRGAGRGAVTVTSGSVSDTWPQADSDEAHKPGSGKAPHATAAKSRRFQTGSRDELRLITPHAANTNAPKASPRGILSYFSAYGLVMFWQVDWEHLAMCPLGHSCEGDLGVPSHDRVPHE
jgi:hypothetical protein